MTEKVHRVAVVGGGISGLAACRFAQKRLQDSSGSKRIILIEQGQRLGGWLHSLRTPEGFVFEAGPSSIRTVGSKGRATLRLVDELGLRQQVVPCSSLAIKNRYLYTNGSLLRLPNHPLKVLGSPLMRSAVFAFLREWTVPRSQQPDESIHSFFTRRFSPVVADTLTDALSIGIFGGRSQSLSIKSCFPFLHEYEQKYGSIGLGMLREMLASRSGPQQKNETSKSTKNEAEEETDEGYLSPAVQEMQKMKVYSFREGVETLSRALEQKIREDEHTDVLLNTAVERMDQERDGTMSLSLGHGMTVRAEKVISALPSHALAHCLRHHPTLERDMLQIPFASLALVHLAYTEPLLPAGVEGFGYLVPAMEQQPILGVQFNSSAFPQQDPQPGCTRFTVMMRVEKGQENRTKDEWQAIALDSLQRHLRLPPAKTAALASPARVNVSVDLNAIPQYVVGHAALVDSIRGALQRDFPSLHLVGNSWGGVGVNDCVENAWRTVHRLQL